MKETFKNKFLRYYLCIISLNNLGANIYNMIFVVYLASTYQSKLLVGLADSIVYIPALFGIWVGFLADNTKQKAGWLVRLSALQTVMFLIIAFIIQFENYLIVLVIALLNIISDIIARYLGELIRPIFKHNVPDDDLESAYSTISAVSLVVVLGSQVLGTWLLSQTNHNYSLLAVLNAVFFLMSSLLYWRARPLMTYSVRFQTTAKETISQQLSKLYDTTKQVFKRVDNLVLLPTLLMMVISNILAVSLNVFLNMIFLETPIMGLTYAQSIVLVGIVQILGSLVGSLSINTFLTNLSISHLFLCDGVVLVSVALAGLMKVNPIVMIPGIALLTFSVGRFGPKFDAALMRHVPSEQLGQVNTFVSSIVTISLPLASIGFSFLGAHHLVTAWLVFLALASLLLMFSFKGLFGKDDAKEGL